MGRKENKMYLHLRHNLLKHFKKKLILHFQKMNFQPFSSASWPPLWCLIELEHLEKNLRPVVEPAFKLIIVCPFVEGWGWLSTVQVAEMLWRLPPWRYSKDIWMWSCEIGWRGLWAGRRVSWSQEVLSGLSHPMWWKQILSKGLQVLMFVGGRRRIQNIEHWLVKPPFASLLMVNSCCVFFKSHTLLHRARGCNGC